MNVGVDGTCGQDFAFTGYNLSGTTNGNFDLWLNIGVACFSDFPNSTGFYADIRFINPTDIYNQRIGNYGIRDFSMIGLSLSHAVTNDFTTAKFDFFTVVGQVLFDLEPQIGIG